MQDTTLSALEATGHVWMTVADRDHMLDIDNRIKFGDETGWLGDPSFYLCFAQQTGQFEVWGTDRAGRDYRVLTADELDHRIIIRLRENDPRKGADAWQKVLDKNAKLEADNAAKDHEKFAQVADKLAWGIRQDFGHLMGGKGGVIHIPQPAYKKKAG